MQCWLSGPSLKTQDDTASSVTNGKPTYRCFFFFCPRQFHKIKDCRDFLVYFSRARRQLWFIYLFLAWFLASFLSGFKLPHNNALNHFQSNRHQNDIAIAYLPKLYSTSAFPMLVALLMQACPEQVSEQYPLTSSVYTAARAQSCLHANTREMKTSSKACPWWQIGRASC